MVMIDSLFNKYRERLILEDVETRLASLERKSFNTDTSIPTEEIFDVAAASPGVIAAYVTIVRAQHRTAFTGALHDVDQRRIRRELGIGESIRAPEIHIPFAVPVPVGARRHIGHLLRLFP